MGRWNLFGRRRENELREAQREEAEINAQFRREVNITIKRHETEISQLLQELDNQRETIEALSAQVRSLKRDRSSEAKKMREKVEQDLEIAKREQARKTEEKNIKENERELSEAEYREAKKFVAQVKEDIESAFEDKNEIRLESIEKKLKDVLLIFKKRFKDGEYKNESFKMLKMASEILFNIADYYYDNKKYKKALEFFLEAEEFDYNKKNILFDRIVRCNYEVGKYEEAWEYLNKFSISEDDEEGKYIIEENLLRLEISIKLEKYAEARDTIFKLKNILIELNNKSETKKFVNYIREYLKEREEEDIVSLLFFLLLYLRDFKTVESILENYEFAEKKFFKGILLLRGNNKEEGFSVLREFLNTLYGCSFYFSNIQWKFKDDELKYLDDFLQKDINEIDNKNYILNKENLINKKYEFLAYKIEFLFKKKIIDFNSILNEIKIILTQDEKEKKFKGNSIFWSNLLKVIEYLKSTDNDLVKEYETILYLHLTEKDIEIVKSVMNEEEIDIDIDNEYHILGDKSEKSFYREKRCENNLTKKEKVFIEYYETMSETTRFNRKISLQNDKALGEKNDCFLKIDNFSIVDNSIKIVMDSYDKTYEDVVGDYSSLTFDERLEKAFEILEIFKVLEKEKIVIPKLNIDNLVIKDNSYKLRLFNFTKNLGDESLASTKSKLNKKCNRYRSPEITLKSQSLESNIFILGLIFYDIFYGEDILKGVLDPKLNKEYEMGEVQDAFYEGTSIKKELVSNNKPERFYDENLEKKTVKLRRVLAKYYVPQDITNLLEEMLNTNKLLRPTFKEIEERLDEIRINTKNFNDFIPNNFLKKDLNKFIKSISRNIQNFVIRDESLKDIYPNTILDKNAPALMVITLKNGKDLEISDLGRIYTAFLVEEEDILEKNSRDSLFEDVKKKLEEILNNDEELEKFAKKNEVDIETAEQFIFYMDERLENYKKTKILDIKNEDLNLFLTISTISKKDAKKIIKENNVNDLLKVLNEVI